MKRRTAWLAGLLTGATFLIAPTAWAHVTLEVSQAPIGASYKAVLRVPHGCEGAATTALKVRIPEGVIGVKPMPKPGWDIKLVHGQYAATHTLFGAKVNSGVTEIDWVSGSLPDDYYDEFVFRAYLSSDLAANTTLYVPVVQECGDRVMRWIDVPAEGQPRADSPTPAPGLQLLPAKKGH